MYLVGADRHQVNAHRRGLERQFAESLHRIAMNKCGRLRTRYRSSRRFDGLNSARLVVDRHDAHEYRIGSHGFKKLALADAPVFVNAEAYDFKALVFEMLDRLINARMLDARRHYPSAAPAHGMSRALNGKIVALRSAGGEIHLVIPAEEPARHIRARVFEHFVRLYPLLMQGRWVAPKLCYSGFHRFNSFTAHGGRGAVVKIRRHKKNHSKPHDSQLYLYILYYTT